MMRERGSEKCITAIRFGEISAGAEDFGGNWEKAARVARGARPSLPTHGLAHSHETDPSSARVKT